MLFQPMLVFGVHGDIVMDRSFVFCALLLSAFVATPAYAGAPVPTPEAGAGLAAMALMGAGYYYLKRRTGRR